MTDHPARDRITLALLAGGVAVPILYYGVQLLAASFEPNYSFVTQAASELGSDRAARPAVFNAGLMMLGIVTLLAAFGFQRAFARLRVHPLFGFLAAAAVAMSGFQTLWAGYFPLPDPRHGGHPAFIVSMIALPVLLTAALWKGSGRLLKTYFVATLLLLAVMFPVMSRAVFRESDQIRGLLQRVYTLTVFPPVGVAAWALARRLQRSAAPPQSL